MASPIAVLESKSGTMQFYTLEALKVWYELEVALHTQPTAASYTNALEPTVEAMHEGFSLSEWVQYAKKKSQIASATSRVNGALKARLTQISSCEAVVPCASHVDPLALSDPWLNAKPSTNRACTKATFDSASLWSGWGKKLSNDDPPPQVPNDSVGVAEVSVQEQVVPAPRVGPQGAVAEKLVEGPQMLTCEEMVPAPQVTVVEKGVEVPQLQPVEKIVSVPQVSVQELSAREEESEKMETTLWLEANAPKLMTSFATTTKEKPAVSKNYDDENKVEPSEPQSEGPKEMEVKMKWTKPTTGRPKCASCGDRIHEPAVYRRGLPFHAFCALIDQEEEIEYEIWQINQRRNAAK